MRPVLYCLVPVFILPTSFILSPIMCLGARSRLGPGPRVLSAVSAVAGGVGWLLLWMGSQSPLRVPAAETESPKESFHLARCLRHVLGGGQVLVEGAQRG